MERHLLIVVPRGTLRRRVGPVGNTRQPGSMRNLRREVSPWCTSQAQVTQLPGNSGGMSIKSIPRQTVAPPSSRASNRFASRTMHVSLLELVLLGSRPRGVERHGVELNEIGCRRIPPKELAIVLAIARVNNGEESSGMQLLVELQGWSLIWNVSAALVFMILVRASWQRSNGLSFRKCLLAIGANIFLNGLWLPVGAFLLWTYCFRSDQRSTQMAPSGPSLK